MENLPETLLESVRYFSDLDICHAYMAKIKWPGGIACPHCDSKKIGIIASRKMLQCKDCRKQFSYKVGTIFEDSPLGLDKWFAIIFSIANDIKISSENMSKIIGVSQKTAWRMVKIITIAMEIA